MEQQVVYTTSSGVGPIKFCSKYKFEKYRPI